MCGGILFVGLVLSSSSCRQTTEKGAHRAQILSGRELPLVVSGLESEPRRYLSGDQRVAVSFSVDPELVRLRDVSRYCLWARASSESEWTLVATSAPGESTLSFEPDEGVHGLRGSVVYDDGSADLVPQAWDRPIAHLYVDKSAPVLRWVKPEPGAAVGAAGSERALDLRWENGEPHPGERATILEWSEDRGETWQLIAQVEPATGQRRYTWKLPEELGEDLVLRVRAWDSVGHGGEATLALRRPAGPSDAGDGVGIAAVQRPAPQNGRKTEGQGAVESSKPPTAPERASAEDGAASPEPATADSTSSDLVCFDGFESDCLRGASTQRIGWTQTGEGLDSGAPVYLEYSLGEPGDWERASEAILGDGSLLWDVPDEPAAECRLRLLVAGDEGERIIATHGPLMIDGEAPVARFKKLPEVLGAAVRLPLAVEEGGCAAISGIRVYLRESGGGWSKVPPERARLGSGELILDLSSLAESTYEVFLAAEDELGNRCGPPAPDAESLGRFALDRTPPRISARPSDIPWVGGFQGEVVVEFDASDCVPPLVIEGREGAGDWIQLRQLSSLALPRGAVAFQVPANARAYQARISVQDAAGNWARVALDPRSVERAIRGDFAGAEPGGSGSPGDEAILVERTRARIAWQVHRLAREYEDELQVSIERQDRRGGDWLAIREGLSPGEIYYWEVPPAGAEGSGEHRLRLRLLRRGDLVGEDVSGPFRIVSLSGGESEGPLPKISELSMKALEEAGVAFARYREAAESRVGEAKETASSEELEELAGEARDRYMRAIVLDENNYHATFGLAQLLQLRGAEESQQEVIRWLEATVAIAPDHALALNDLGAASIRARDYARAEKVLRRSLEARETGKGRYNLGLALLYQGKTGPAREQLEKALASEADEGPSDGDVHFYTIHSYILEGRLDIARRLYAENRNRISEALRGDLETKLGS